MARTVLPPDANGTIFAGKVQSLASTPTPRTKREYTEEQRIAALSAIELGESPEATSKRMGIPTSTIRTWQDDALIAQEPDITNPSTLAGLTPDQIQERISFLQRTKSATIADMLEVMAWQILRSMVGKLDKASLKDSAYALGVIVEKMLLLRGKPTSISLQSDLVRLAEFRARYAPEDPEPPPMAITLPGDEGSNLLLPQDIGGNDGRK